MSRLVNHHGRVTEPKEVEQIKASDLLKLMDVVKAATGLWNALELHDEPGTYTAEYDQLAAALRALGLIEVTP